MRWVDIQKCMLKVIYNTRQWTEKIEYLFALKVGVYLIAEM
jgi:hypothetical protein